MGFLCFELFTKGFYDPLCIFLNLFHALFKLILFKDDLRCRIDADRFKLLKGSLGKNVKASYGLYLIAPKFYSERIFLCKVKDIYDISADRKLTRSFNLIISGVAHGNKLFTYLRFIDLSSFIYGKYVRLYNFRLYLRCHQGSKSRHHCYRSSLNEAPQAPDTLPCDLIAVDIRLIKDKILGRIHSNVPVVELIVLIDLFCPKIRIGHYYPVLKALTQPINEMELLRVHTASDLATGKRFLKIFTYFIKFLKFP